MQKRSKILAASLTATAATASVLVSTAPAQAVNASAVCLTVWSVNMCSEVQWSGAHARAHGSTTDRDGGPNMNVKVRDIKLQQYNGSSWRTIRSSDDYDGWAAYGETGRTTYAYACGYANKVFRATATYDFKGVVNGKQILETRVVTSRMVAASGCGTSNA